MTKRFIAVAGNIGAGKSTLTRLLSQRLKWEPFYEAETENPYLADFYEDMAGFAFHSQIFFLSKRLRHLKRLALHPGPTVQDRTIYEDAEVFARALYLGGYINPRDYHTYRELYEAASELLPSPDLVVYLRASVPTLLDRIAQRGRGYERVITPAYLEQLSNLYEAWLGSFSLCPVLTVPADTLDFVHSETNLALVVAKIEEKLSGKDEVVFD